MTNQELLEIAKELFQKCLDTLESKGRVYSGRVDAFRNFTSIADELGINRKIVWWVYFRKHIDAIRTYITCDYKDPEPIEGRIMDAINYLILLYGMIEQEKEFKEE
jgi:hypothetical protein